MAYLLLFHLSRRHSVQASVKGAPPYTLLVGLSTYTRTVFRANLPGGPGCTVRSTEPLSRKISLRGVAMYVPPWVGCSQVDRPRKRTQGNLRKIEKGKCALPPPSPSGQAIPSGGCWHHFSGEGRSQGPEHRSKLRKTSRPQAETKRKGLRGRAPAGADSARTLPCPEQPAPCYTH